MFVYDDGWATGTFFVAGAHYDSEEESYVDNSEPSASKSGSPQTGDTGADDVPVYLLLLLFSLVSIVVVKRRVPGVE